MGAHIQKIVVATNENDMLHQFFKTGRYEPPKKDGKDFVAVTNAPSMDIAKSSNFERMLFDMVDGDSDRIKNWYDNLGNNGYFQVDSATLKRIQEVFVSSRSSNKERESAIEQFGDQYDHGIDPHTAAAVVPWLRDIEFQHNHNIPVVFLETSHVAQFGDELREKEILVP